MPFLPLQLPPGMVKPGTVYDARGRWYDGNLVRWHAGVLQPFGGWSPMQTTTPSVGDVSVGVAPRGMLAFRGTDAMPILGVGTYSGLWMYRGGLLSDITPAGFTTGRLDAETVTTSGSTYGSAAYGAGPYGTGTDGLEEVRHATTWQLDNFGQNLVACSSDDGKLYWQTNPPAASVATAITNAPVSNRGVVVTPERFVVALGADGNPRLVKWCDQEDPTTWTASSLNQAGDLTLATPGVLMAGRRGVKETLLWTDVDLWRMQFIGGTLVYSITQAGSQCGAISPNSMVMAGGKAFWMASKSFFVYDGFTRPLPCEVADYVFSGLNYFQRSKVTVFMRSQFNEVVWHYPSAGSQENDRYVAYNYAEGYWTVGTLERTAGEDSAVFGFPIAADASGTVFQHEISGGSYSGGVSAFIESGPVEVAAGDHVFMARQLIPDANTLGSVTMSLYSSFYPAESEALNGPYTLAAPTDVRITARQLRLRVDGVLPNWRVGTVRLEVMPSGKR